jgi:hypothetical protein
MVNLWKAETSTFLKLVHKKVAQAAVAAEAAVAVVVDSAVDLVAHADLDTNLHPITKGSIFDL